jgi:hypothetical protein
MRPERVGSHAAGWRAALRACLVISLAFADSLPAELVLMVGGGVLKVDGFSRTGDQIELDLSSGGSLTVPVLRIDRILADEIEKAPADALSAGHLEVDFSGEQSVPDTPFGDLIFATAKRHAVNPQLVAAMVLTESAFDPVAVSRKGAAGLLQLMPSTARRFGVTSREVFIPEHNLEAGVRYLRWLIDRFDGDLELALAGYNAGEASVDRYRGVPPYRETHDYIRRVYSAAVAGDGAGGRE